MFFERYPRKIFEKTFGGRLNPLGKEGLIYLL